MFENWGFLLGEIWTLILLAALLGLLAGWLIWNRSKELLGLRSELDHKTREVSDLNTRISGFDRETDGYKSKIAQIETDYGQVVSSRDKALADLQTHKERTDSLQSDLDARASRVGTLEADIERLKVIETEREQALAAKAEAQSEHATEIRRVRERDEEITQLKAQMFESKGSAGRVQSLEADLASAVAKAGQLSAVQADLASRDKELASLRAELAAAKADLKGAADKGQVDALTQQLDQCRRTVETRDAVIEDLRAKANGASADYDGDGIIEGKDEGSKPVTLTSARGGKADDLKMIKGVGPKLEGMLHKLGFFHFDQVASWSSQEVAWVDANLEGFNGRVSRDRWIEQAKILAAGGTTEFAERVGDGDVYDS